MNHPLADRITGNLGAVARIRAQRAADPALAQRVLAVKTYQSQRFARAYADLLVHPRYGAAARFFLQDLYGPQEFSRRDAQFERVVPALVRLFPGKLLDTIDKLCELHALTETMDDSVAQHLPSLPCTAVAYATAWQGADQAQPRERQVVLTLAIGTALDSITRSRLMRSTLRLMRGPAHAAGLQDLQRFLETGFDAFVEMGGAGEFLGLVAQRERALVAALSAPGAPAQAALPPEARPAPLNQLP